MLEFDRDLINKYDIPCPRYTSYPTALQFTDKFSYKDYLNMVEISNTVNKPLSLYVHLPFCATLCYFCACNKIITKNKTKGENYLVSFKKELELKAPLFNKNRKVEQLHFGGGTPTFYSDYQLSYIMQMLRDNFNLYDDDNGEYSMEIDPRTTDKARIAHLKKIGLNRISLGVQDFNEKVQKAVNRIQPYNITKSVIDAARENNFNSVNLDLIYGLPFQTLDTFKDTLEKTIELSPDRISLFNYAHLPSRFTPQKRILEQDLPKPEEKLQILKLSIETLTSSGYEFIGMDHFAKKDDELTIAQSNKTLYRNFQGYSTYAECDLVGLGVSAISQIGNSFSQNAYTVDQYTDFLDQGNLPIIKGIIVDRDDQLRKKIIMDLICNLKLNFNSIEEEFNIDFKDYFKNELRSLKDMQKDKLLTLDQNSITIFEQGRLLIRNICSTFDRYFQAKVTKDRHSRAI